MIAHLDRFVRGQARAKQDIAVAVYNHYLSQAWRDRGEADLGRHHILMIGPTGVGKTYLVKILADFLAVPVGFASATGLVEAGYKGNSVETIVASVLHQADGNVQKAEKGIVFLDEVDKIKRGDTGGTRDVSGEGVQNALLTLLDGRGSEGMEGYEHSTVDTSRLLFVCTGAFVGLDEIITERLGTAERKIGFGHRENEAVESIPDQPIYSALCQAETRDLVDFGMIPEFIGRFATITALHELGTGDLRKIVSTATENSALERQRQLAALHGIDLVIADDALDAIAEEASRLGTGARGLHRLIGQSVDAVDHRWTELAAEGVTRVVIDRDCIENGSDPRLEKGKPDDRIAAAVVDELRQECLSLFPPPPSGDRPYRDLPRPLAGARKQDDGITDTSGWSDEAFETAIEELKESPLGYGSTTGSALKWWDTFEEENEHRPALIFRLVEELANRKATISEFFLSYVYSNTDNIQANLHYLDYKRLKDAEEKESDDDSV
ncbi:UNVERIFIED_CONTAM: hypothetical protein GTU68_004532 [Idotea baltica]|nr:hypothetical protein [Idotea baltica]